MGQIRSVGQSVRTFKISEGVHEKSNMITHIYFVRRVLGVKTGQ